MKHSRHEECLVLVDYRQRLQGKERGNLIQRLLSLIYDMFTVKLDKKEEKW